MDGNSVLLSGQKLFGIDAFGWGVILFLLLLFGIPYTLYFLRRADIPEWPIISARIEKTEVLSGPPREVYPVPVPMPFPVTATQLIPYHCRVRCVFLADGSLYEASYALEDQTILGQIQPTRSQKLQSGRRESTRQKSSTGRGKPAKSPRLVAWIPKENSQEKNHNFITFYFYERSLEYPQALSSSICSDCIERRHERDFSEPAP